MKGIILAGGSGTRLYPLTRVVSKQLIPVYDKPMIYYPLSILMLAGIRDILIISTPMHLPSFRALFGDGSHLGLSIKYEVQKKPEGLAQAYIIGEEFVNGEPSCLILGDNIIHGSKSMDAIKEMAKITEGAGAFGYYVKDPRNYGVVEIDKFGKAISIEEKPANPKSNYAIPGIYFFDGMASEIADTIKPSERGELEITDMLKYYMEQESFKVAEFKRGTTWLDAGTVDDLNEASAYVRAVQTRQGLMIACLEEIAFNQAWMDIDMLRTAAKIHGKTEYGQYLIRIANTHVARTATYAKVC